MKKIIVGIIGGCIATAMMASSATAETTTTIEHQKRATETFVDELPCVGEARITITHNTLYRSTENKNSFSETFQSSGKFVANPTEDGLPTYAGRFSQHGSSNVRDGDARSETFTFTVVGRTEDGTRLRFHVTAHITATKNRMVVEFERAKCATA